MSSPPASGHWNRSQEAETRFWEGSADRYGHFSAEYWERMLAQDGLDPSFFEGARVIELGCGPFGMIHYLDTPREKIGCDPLIETYRELGLLQDGGVTHLAGRGERVDLPAGSVDVVISYNVLDHVDDPLGSLREAHRLLTEGGRMYLNVHSFPGFLRPVLPWLRYVDTPHPWHFTTAGVRRLLGRAGFEIDRSLSYPVRLPGSSFKQRVAQKIALHAVFLAHKT
ncbi:MAG: class I SAM-dependent methyltransferase [Planctomycetota bacterium]|nr:class I SAM-dependent methyltransferase [Planctomycetota bacterium]